MTIDELLLIVLLTENWISNVLSWLIWIDTGVIPNWSYVNTDEIVLLISVQLDALILTRSTWIDLVQSESGLMMSIDSEWVDYD